MEIKDRIRKVFRTELQIINGLKKGDQEINGTLLGQISGLSQSRQEAVRLLQQEDWKFTTGRAQLLSGLFVPDIINSNNLQDDSKSWKKPADTRPIDKHMICIASGEEGKEGQFENCNI